MQRILFNQERTCVETRKKKTRNELIRITLVNEVWKINQDDKIQGRSFYLDKDRQIIENFTNKKKFGYVRRFKMTEKFRLELLNYAQNL